MANRFGTNDPNYDLSRILTLAGVQTPGQSILVAPIILDNPSITTGVALLSHIIQPFNVGLLPGQELRLIDLDFGNVGLAGSQFYGIKIQTNTSVVDTGAGIAVFNVGQSDGIYINAAGKLGSILSTTPTGIGIDINKEIASSAERTNANGHHQGIQIFDWSTTNQGVGGPRCVLLQKQGNKNTDHFLMTTYGNRNHHQMVVISGDAGYNGGMPVWRLDDETTAENWLSLVARGEFIFNKDGVGVQWITPGSKTAYILASTNDLKLKSGGTGVRFVNQADTQTIVMMQDDLSVDIPNNETRFQALKVVSDRIEQYATNGLGSVSINYNGYNGGTTQFRDTKIFDGKQNVVAIFEGSTASLTVTNKIGVGVTPLAPVHVKGAATGEQLRLDDTSATGNPYISFFQSGTRRAFLQSNDTSDTVILASEYGDVSIKAASTAGSDTDTEYIRVIAGGFVKIDGLIYGGMYADNISQSVTIAATDTHYEVGGGLSGGNVNGVTFQNSKELLIAAAGVYLITYSISVQCATANQEVESSVMVNSTASTRLSAHAMVTPANTPNVLAGSQPISLAVNDVVKFCLANHTATNDLTVSHANMSIVRIGA